MATIRKEKENNVPSRVLTKIPTSLNSNKMILRQRGPIKEATETQLNPIGKRMILGDVVNKKSNTNKKTEVTKAQPVEKIFKKPIPIVSKHPENTNVSSKSAGAIMIKREESDLAKRLKEAVTTTSLTNLEPAPVKIPVDIDAPEYNPLLVSEYIKDIMQYSLSLEEKYQIKQNYLTKKHKTNERMRAVLVNWMVDVLITFKCLPETLHLSIAILDRYLQCTDTVDRSTLQLVGTASILIAAKYEEVCIPDIGDYVYICDDSFTVRQILEMESDILKKLNFCFGRPYSLQFLRRYNKVAKISQLYHDLGKYLLELALLEYKLCHIKPSLQAASACCLSMCILNDSCNPRDEWSDLLEFYSTYKYDDIKQIIYEFSALLLQMETSKYQVIRIKYAAPVYGKISENSKITGRIVKRLAQKAILLKS